MLALMLALMLAVGPLLALTLATAALLADASSLPKVSKNKRGNDSPPLARYLEVSKNKCGNLIPNRCKSKDHTE
jgi:hypothetical protein